MGSMFRTLFSIVGKWNSYVSFFTYLSITPRMLTVRRNYCFTNAPRFLPNNYSVIGNFFSDFLSKILFFLDFYSSSFSHAVTKGTLGFLVYPPLRMKQGSSSSGFF